MVALSLTKTSFAVTLIHITRAWQRYIIWFIISSISAVFIVHTVLLWRPFCNSETPMDLPVSCWDAKHAVVLNVFSSLYSSAADFVLALLPVNHSLASQSNCTSQTGLTFWIVEGPDGLTDEEIRED